MYKLLGVHILLSTPGTHLPDVRRSSRLCRVVLHDRAQLCRQVARGCRCRLYLNTGVSHFVYSGCKLHFPTVHSAVQQYVDTYLKVGKAGHGRDQGLCQVASPTMVCVGRRRRSNMFNKYGCNRSRITVNCHYFLPESSLGTGATLVDPYIVGKDSRRRTYRTHS